MHSSEILLKKKFDITSGVYPYLILIILPFSLYFHVVNFGFSGFDDEAMFLNKSEFIKNIGNVPLAFKRDAFINVKGDSFYRPVATISYMLDAQIGGSNLWIYHLDNLLLHIASLILLFYLLTKLGLQKKVSLILLTLFSIHPMFTHAVCWIPARMDLLLAVFGLVSIIMLIKYLETNNILFISLHALFFFMVVFSKETALLLPIVYMLLMYMQKGNLDLKRFFRIAWIWGFIAVGYLFLRSQVIHNSSINPYVGIIPFLKNLPTVPITIAKLIIPWNYSPLPRFEVVFTISGIMMVIWIVFDILKHKSEYQTIKFLGVVWFLITTLPPTIFIHPLESRAYSYLEHRAYFPLFGLSLYIIPVIIETKIDFSLYKVQLFCACLFTLFGTVAFTNSYNYVSPGNFFSAAINANPTSAFALNSRAMYRFKIADAAGAAEDLDAAIVIAPDYAPPFNNKGSLFIRNEDYDSSIVCLNKAIRLDTMYAAAYVNRAIAWTKKGNNDNAIADYKRALAIDSTLDYVYYSLGNLLAMKGYYQTAIEQYTRAIAQNPQYFEAYNNRANMMCKLKDYTGALTDCDKALSIKYHYPRALFNKANAYFNLGQFDTAIKNLDTAIAEYPDFTNAYSLKAIILLAEGKKDEAKKLAQQNEFMNK